MTPATTSSTARNEQVALIVQGLPADDAGDRLQGVGADRVHGGDGHDFVNAAASSDDPGDDRLDGGPGDDEVAFAGAGDDRLDGGPCVDRLDGRQGTDACLNGERVKRCE